MKPAAPVISMVLFSMFVASFFAMFCIRFVLTFCVRVGVSPFGRDLL